LRMKIWEVEFATEDGSLGVKLVCADNYQDAIKIVDKGIIADAGLKLTKREKATLHVQKVALYCETDYGA